MAAASAARVLCFTYQPVSWTACRLLKKQEEEREEKLRAFKAGIEAKAASIGKVLEGEAVKRAALEKKRMKEAEIAKEK